MKVRSKIIGAMFCLMLCTGGSALAQQEQKDYLSALEADHDFLKAGGVFTDDLIETWIEYKRLNEVDAIRLRPHPWEFMLYYDI